LKLNFKLQVKPQSKINFLRKHEKRNKNLSKLWEGVHNRTRGLCLLPKNQGAGSDLVPGVQNDKADDVSQREEFI